MANKRFNKQVPGYGFKRGGHVNTSRENRLEELGRVDAERARTSRGRRNLRDEKYRIRSELKASRDESYGKWGHGKGKGRINR